jgi:hypothetical protein
MQVLGWSKIHHMGVRYPYLGVAGLGIGGVVYVTDVIGVFVDAIR